VNLANDIDNCGSCGNKCSGTTPFCNGTSCVAPPCSAINCATGTLCCGSNCCAQGDLCCQVNQGGPTTGPTCQKPVDGTCPVGCPACQ
jgi:hypothetical protein